MAEIQPFLEHKQTENLLARKGSNFFNLEAKTIVDNFFVVFEKQQGEKDVKARENVKNRFFSIENIKKGLKSENEIKRLLKQVKTNEKNFLSMVTNGQKKPKDFENDEERMKQFGSYLRLQEYYYSNSEDPTKFEPFLSSEDFENFLIEGIIQEVTKKNKPDFDTVLLNALKYTLGKKEGGKKYFDSFYQESRDVYNDLVTIYGKGTMKLIKTHFETESIKNKEEGEAWLREKIKESGSESADIYGFINEELNRYFAKNLYNKNEKLTINVTTSGTSTRSRKTVIGKKMSVRYEEDKTAHYKFVGLPGSKEVFQKADGIITVMGTTKKGVNTSYKLYISNKFRYGGRSTLDLQKPSSLNTTLPRIQEMFTNLGEKKQKALMSELIFSAVNTTPNAIFAERIEEFKHILEQLSGVYMFNDIAETSLQDKSFFNIHLFQLNDMIIPFSIILKSLLEEDIKSYITVKIEHPTNILESYKELRDAGTFGIPAAIYLRDTVLTTSKLGITFHRNLMNNKIISNV